MTATIPIIADIPTDSPGLGFGEYVDALSDAIRGGEPPQFTVGLYGPWGSGKSSLLTAIHQTLTSHPREVVPVLFDAWRHERSEHLVVPLLHAIVSAVAVAGPPDLAKALRKALAAVVFSLNFSIAGVGVDTSRVRDQWQADTLTKLDEAFAEPFQEMRSIPEALAGRRIAVLVDDLDRCSPEHVVSVLEAINVVMDVPGFVFVLALDYDVLVRAVGVRYPHVSGHEFIQKIVQLPFRVPPLSTEDPAFLSELIPQWSEWGSTHSTEFQSSVVDIAVLALEANPRQIKRFANSFLVLERIIELRKLRVDMQLLVALLGLQLRWPTYYQDFQDAVLAGDENPDRILADSDDGGLSRYADRLLSGRTLKIGDLQDLLRLTNVVGGEDVVSDPDSASSTRKANKDTFIEELGRRGFTADPQRSDRCYYNRDSPHVRFKMSKHVVRFEKRRAPTWQWRLWESYLLTRELELALRVIDEPEVHFTNRS